MTERAHETTSDEATEQRLDGQSVRTGVTDVDGVLDEIEGLGETPLDQHVRTFERAHVALRETLDAPTVAESPHAEPA